MTVTAIESVTRHKMRVSLDGEPAFVFTDREIRDLIEQKKRHWFSMSAARQPEQR